MRLRAFGLFIGGMAIFGTGYMLVSLARGQLRVTEPGLDYSPFEGKEIGLVLLVSPSCSGSNDPRLPDAWSDAVERVQNEAERTGARVSLTALSFAAQPERGITFLERFGSFHEVVSGRGWEGMGARVYVYGDLGGPPAVPQIAVVQRNIDYAPDGGPPVFSNERVRERYVGVPDILRWLNR